MGEAVDTVSSPQDDHSPSTGNHSDTSTSDTTDHNLATYVDPEGRFSFQYSERFAVREITGEFPPDYSTSTTTVKLIPEDRIDLLGKKECMYGERGVVETCTADKENGIGVAILNKSFKELSAQLEPTLVDTTRITGQQVVIYAMGAEGYGATYYYIPISDTTTAVLYRSYSPNPGPTPDELETVLNTFEISS